MSVDMWLSLDCESVLLIQANSWAKKTANVDHFWIKHSLISGNAFMFCFVFLFSEMVQVLEPKFLISPHSQHLVSLFGLLNVTVLGVSGPFWNGNRWHEHSGSGTVCHGVWCGSEEAGRGGRGTHSFLQCLQRGHHGAGVLDHVVSAVA